MPENEQVQRLLLRVDLIAVHPVVMWPEGDLLDGFLPWYMQFGLQIEQAEVVTLEAAVFAAELFVGGGELGGGDGHG